MRVPSFAMSSLAMMRGRRKKKRLPMNTVSLVKTSYLSDRHAARFLNIVLSHRSSILYRNKKHGLSSALESSTLY